MILKQIFFFSELFKMAVKASRDSSGVGEAQHTWFTTAKRLLNNRSAAAVSEAQRIVCVCQIESGNVCETQDNSPAWFGREKQNKKTFLLLPLFFPKNGKKEIEIKITKKKNNKIFFHEVGKRKNCTPFRCGAHCRLAVLARSGERRVRWREEPHSTTAPPPPPHTHVNRA